MKTNFVRLLIPVLVSVFGNSAFAGNSGGGGNLTRSTYADINKVLDTSITFYRLVGDLVEQTKPGAPVRLSDKRVIDAVRKLEVDPLASQVISGKIMIFENNPSGIDLIKNYSKDKTCKAILNVPDRERDLANAVTVVAGTKTAKICIEMNRLTHFPVSGLDVEIGAGFIHELIEIAHGTHKDAKYVQEYVIRHYDSTCFLQIYPTENEMAQGQPDRYRVFLRILPEWVSLDNPRIVSEYLIPPNGGNMGEDAVLAELHDPARVRSVWNVSKAHSEVEFNVADRMGSVHRIKGSFGRVVEEVGGGTFYTVVDSEKSQTRFTLDGRPLDIKHVEFMGFRDGCFPK